LEVHVTRTWKVVVLLSLSLNLVCIVVITRMAEVFVDAQRENVGLFLQLSGDQQALRRELNAQRAGGKELGD
jgi:hypothetical protein